MKNLKIFLLLILLIQVLSLTENNEGPLSDNGIIYIPMTKNVEKTIKLPNENGIFNLTIVALKKNVNIIIKKLGVFSTLNETNVQNFSYNSIILDSYKNEDKFITFSVSEDCKVEISGVLKRSTAEYEMFDYKIDSKIEVGRNNFVIFLDDISGTGKDVAKFEMKFKFKDKIVNQNATYGFLYLPVKKNESLVLGKHYNKNDTGNKLNNIKFNKTEIELTINNWYYNGNMSQPENKPYFAFIFSVDSEANLVETFYFTINSEIINLFLIISIVVALVFAVITFFLIRRKQATEGTSISGEESKDEQKTESDENNNNKEVSSEN